MRGYSVILIVLALTATTAPPRVFAQSADRPVRILVPIAAGSQGDRLTRLVADRMRTGLGQPIIVENVTTAFGRAAVNQAKAAPPDGNTLICAALAIMVAFPLSDKTVTYDPIRDFVAVSRAVNYDLAVAVGPATTARSLKQYLDLVKADPKVQGAYAVPGLGGLSHLFGVMVQAAAGVEFTFVPYKGPAATLPDVLGGRIPAVGGPLADFSALHQSGKLRVLATSGPRRSSVLPEVPTFRELGFNVDSQAWYAFFAPAQTPKEIVDRLNQAIVGALNVQEVRDQLLHSGFEAAPSTPAEMAGIVKADWDKWGEVIRLSGFTPDK